MTLTRKTLFAVVLLATLPAIAAAHPLGNFSVNQYSRIEVSPAQAKIRQVLDMAEIPTFQESARIDTDRDGQISRAELDAYSAGLTPDYVSNLQLLLNGSPIQVRPVATDVSLGVGAGNLSTLRITWDLVALLPNAAGPQRLSFRNLNFADRIGWDEIVVQRVPGTSVFDSTAYGSGLTDELKAYPQESLSAPLSERSAEFSFTSGELPAGTRPLSDRDGHASHAVQKDRLAELIAVREMTPAVIFFGLLLAFGLGAMHAMSPGHGKTIVGAYLVGSRGTVRHAVFLGLTVTITHTLGVFALGLVTLFASSYVLPERLMPFLSFMSGLLVFYIGIMLFKNRLFAALGWQIGNYHHGDGHSHEHSDSPTHSHGTFTHAHDGHTHTHLPPESVTWRGLLALGISGGLLPCPSALVLMLSAISLGRVGYGLVLTLIFSLGLAATLTGVGLVFLYVGKAFGSSLGQNRIVKTLPVFSALVVACVGAVICYTSLG